MYQELQENQMLNHTPLNWFKNHQDTIQALRQAIWKPSKIKQPKPANLYAIYRNGKRLECPPMTAKEIDKRAVEQQGAEGLYWYATNGYNLKLVRRA